MLACAGALATAAGSDVSRAAPTSETTQAVQLNETGSALYAARRYAEALRAFERAYALVPEPNILFNIAGCHERLGRRTQAVEYYRWYLGSPSTSPEGRRRAIAALSRLQGTSPAPERPPAAPDADLAPASPAWPLATLGAGLLFAGLGAGLYLDGAHDHNEVTSAPGFGDASGSSTLTEVEARELIDSGDTKKLVGGIAIGLGSALIATHVGLVLWRAGEREPVARSAELRLVPGGWALAGKF